MTAVLVKHVAHQGRRVDLALLGPPATLLRVCVMLATMEMANYVQAVQLASIGQALVPQLWVIAVLVSHAALQRHKQDLVLLDLPATPSRALVMLAFLGMAKHVLGVPPTAMFQARGALS